MAGLCAFLSLAKAIRRRTGPITSQANQWAGRNADGQLEVFAVDADGVVRHRRQNRSDAIGRYG